MHGRASQISRRLIFHAAIADGSFLCSDIGAVGAAQQQRHMPDLLHGVGQAVIRRSRLRRGAGPAVLVPGVLTPHQRPQQPRILLHIHAMILAVSTQGVACSVACNLKATSYTAAVQLPNTAPISTVLTQHCSYMQYCYPVLLLLKTLHGPSTSSMYICPHEYGT